MNNEPSNHEFPAPSDSELDARLTRALARLPDVPVPSNFTSRLMQSVELDELRQSRRRSFAWSWHTLLPRIAVMTAVVLIAGVTLRQHEVSSRRATLARNVAMLAGAQPLPSVEALRNFDAIQRMSQPRADDELLALMQ